MSMPTSGKNDGIAAPSNATCPNCGRGYTIRYTLDGAPIILWVLNTMTMLVRYCHCGRNLADTLTVAEKPKGKP